MRNPGSFRDPSGHVFEAEGRILRAVSEAGRLSYEHVRDSSVVRELQEGSQLVRSTELSRSDWPDALKGDHGYVLEHPRIPYVSYPYEWSFYQLKSAALLHLELQIRLLASGFVLSDASAYNIQFLGPDPIFIDLLSIRPYKPGEYWVAHRQFCEQFLNPLLLRSVLGIPHNRWFRGALEGIETVDLDRLIPTSCRFSWNVFTHVTLQARLDRKALASPARAVEQVRKQRDFPKAAYAGILKQLRRWIGRLHPADAGKTTWGDYARKNTYSEEEALAKRTFVAQFAARARPQLLFDLGCNTGDYAKAALEGGARYVVGFDFDQTAVELAFFRSADNALRFLPLWLDAANPSPNQGWRQAERAGFAERSKANAMIALAFEHHLAIGKNIPLPQVVEWLVSLAPQGVIEFVPKNDTTVQSMLALREDIFPEYDAEHFEEATKRVARVVTKQVISASGRALYHYSTV